MFPSTQHWLLNPGWCCKLLSQLCTCGEQVVSVFVCCRWSSWERLYKPSSAISQYNNMAAPTNHLSGSNQYTSVEIIYGIEQGINLLLSVHCRFYLVHSSAVLTWQALHPDPQCNFLKTTLYCSLQLQAIIQVETFLFIVLTVFFL